MTSKLLSKVVGALFVTPPPSPLKGLVEIQTEVVANASLSPDDYKAFEEQEKLDQAQKEKEENDLAAHYEEIMTEQGQNPIAVAMTILKRALLSDKGYAWSWHCNLAMAIYDNWPKDNTRSKHAISNRGAARIMDHVFGVNTMNTYKEYHKDDE